MPKLSDDNDKYSEWIKGILLLTIVFSMIMMITYPYGWLYACFPRPFTMIIRFIYNPYVGDSLMPIFNPPTPEWGLHYTTIFNYALFAYIGIGFMEKNRINKPFHKLSYVFLLTIVTVFFPFELLYITLYDIFHSIPKFGYPAIWAFGWWKKPIDILTSSVITHDVGSTIFCFGGMYILYNDLKRFYKMRLSFDKRSLFLLMLFILSMVSWVLIPLYEDVPEWGTKWFPQTIYIDYGYYEDYNITWSKDDYGVIAEYWHPNDIVKYHNVISKFISVLFMFYTFLPRRVDIENVGV